MSAVGTVTEIGTVVVVGAGVGGLCAAIRAASAGCRVVLLERADRVGGKLRAPDGIDSGPTVLTMRWAFDRLFDSAGCALDEYVELAALRVLARHAWPDGSTVDLFASIDRTVEALNGFASRSNAEGYRRFCEHTERIFTIVEEPFLRSRRPNIASVVTKRGLRGALAFARIDWHRTMWRSLQDFFDDPRLLQLFGRYATYFGSSPFRAPATLNLIAHVERIGVWRVVGGMFELARALERLARELGVDVRTSAHVDHVELDPATGRACGVRLADGQRVTADSVILNAAPEAVADGRFGRTLRDCVKLPAAPRSLSAVTWTMRARTSGFPLAHHNVFFSSDYPDEFRALERGELPEEPTVYVCAQDRDDVGEGSELERGDPERLLILVNAPARGDEPDWPRPADLDSLETRTFAQLERCGLTVERDGVAVRRTDPSTFERLFPSTGGALYGFATHSMMAPFRRPANATGVPGLFLAGGGAHPGAGVPMVCMSGQLAAEAAAHELAKRSRRP